MSNERKNTDPNKTCVEVCPECKHPQSRRDKLMGNCFWCLLHKLSIKEPQIKKKQGRD